MDPHKIDFNESFDESRMDKLKRFLVNKLGSGRKWKPNEVYQQIQEFGKQNSMKGPESNVFGPCLSDAPANQFAYRKGLWNREALKKTSKRNPFLVLVNPE